MDALSSTTTTTTTLLPKSFISTNLNPLHLHKPPLPPNPNPPPLSTNNKATHSLKPTLSTSLRTFASPTTFKPTLQTHWKAATGYAAALLDAAYCDSATTRVRTSQKGTHPGGSLAAVAKDVRRVKRIVDLVLEDDRVEEEKKGELVMKVVEKGGVYVKLVVLVKMLVEKGKVGVVGEVMQEFGRLWEELCGVKRVALGKEKNKQPKFAI